MSMKSALSGNNASTDVSVFGSPTGAASGGGGGGLALPLSSAAPWSTEAGDDVTTGGGITHAVGIALRRYRDVTIEAGEWMTFNGPGVLVARDITFADALGGIRAYHFGSGGDAANDGLGGKGAWIAASAPDYIAGLMRDGGAGQVTGQAAQNLAIANLLRAWDVGIMGGGGGGGSGLDVSAEAVGAGGVSGASGSDGTEDGGGGGSGIGGGGGGGQTAAGGTNTGGDGGAGGGMLIVICRRFLGSNGLIQADGVDGGAGVATNGGGGGGGGGGGLLIYEIDPANSTATPAATAAAGSGGTADGTGTAGNGGGSGVVSWLRGAQG